MSLKIQITSALPNQNIEKQLDTEIASTKIRAALKKAFTSAKAMPFDLVVVTDNEDLHLARFRYDADSSSEDGSEAISGELLAEVSKVASNLLSAGAHGVDFYYDTTNDDGYCLAFAYDVQK
jgi:hypothetical protein